MKPARELLESGRVSEAKYEPPLLSGYVREGAKNYRSGLRIKSAERCGEFCAAAGLALRGENLRAFDRGGPGLSESRRPPGAAPAEPVIPELAGRSAASSRARRLMQPHDTARDPAAELHRAHGRKGRS